MLSSNSLIMSHGPSPTPTKTIDKGYSLQIARILKKFFEQEYLTTKKRITRNTLLSQLHQQFSFLVGLDHHAQYQHFLSPARTHGFKVYDINNLK